MSLPLVSSVITPPLSQPYAVPLPESEPRGQTPGVLGGWGPREKCHACMPVPRRIPAPTEGQVSRVWGPKGSCPAEELPSFVRPSSDETEAQATAELLELLVSCLWDATCDNMAAWTCGRGNVCCVPCMLATLAHAWEMFGWLDGTSQRSAPTTRHDTTLQSSHHITSIAFPRSVTAKGEVGTTEAPATGKWKNPQRGRKTGTGKARKNSAAQLRRLHLSPSNTTY